MDGIKASTFISFLWEMWVLLHDSSEFCMHKPYFAYVKLRTKYTLINLWLLSSLKFLKFVAGECCSWVTW